MNRTASILVTAVGLTIATGAAAKIPDGAQFPSTLPAYWLGMVLLLGGGLGWRLAENAPTDDSRDAEAQRSLPSSLPLLANRLATLVELAPTIDDREIRDQIDVLIAEYVAPLSSNAAHLRREMGSRRASALLIQGAGCERLLNRAWSAIADANRAEALDALQAAQAFAAEGPS